MLTNDDIKSIIKTRKTEEAKNEYRLIKSNDESDHLKENNNSYHEIEDIQKEINELKADSENKIDSTPYTNMDELKVQILDQNEEGEVNRNNYTQV